MSCCTWIGCCRLKWKAFCICLFDCITCYLCHGGDTKMIFRNKGMRGADGGPWRRLCAWPAFWLVGVDLRTVYQLSTLTFFMHSSLQVLGINMAVGVDGVVGKPMIRQGREIRIFIGPKLRDLLTRTSLV